MNSLYIFTGIGMVYILLRFYIFKHNKRTDQQREEDMKKIKYDIDIHVQNIERDAELEWIKSKGERNQNTY